MWLCLEYAIEQALCLSQFCVVCLIQPTSIEKKKMWLCRIGQMPVHNTGLVRTRSLEKIPGNFSKERSVDPRSLFVEGFEWFLHVLTKY